ncbi:MAG: hypothetical protein KAY37_10135 [Phycisphaerae bacterium]|nr:hypothetical protein [Phycisphaerae bacterium]
MKSVMPYITMVLALGALSSGALAQLMDLYDVDFGYPPHPLNQPPVTGAGTPPRDRPTLVWPGDPTVVSSCGYLTDRPCRFGNGTTGGGWTGLYRRVNRL